MKGKWRYTFGMIYIVLAVSFNNLTSIPADEQKTIPYPKSYRINNSDAAAYEHKGDHPDSSYYKHLDFYNMKPNGNFNILLKFKTYQQTKEWTCGPSAALMVLYHYNVTDWDELGIWKAMHKKQALNKQIYKGTSTEEIVKFFMDLGWEVTSSISEVKTPNGKTFGSVEKFREWVIRNLKDNTPIMVEFADWGGHWLDIIGYDTMGTARSSDDVIIFADSYDTSDHLQDGYYLYPAERFYYMWFDGFLLPRDQSIQQWIIAKPS